MLEAIYRARETLKLPAIDYPAVRQGATGEVSSHSRLASRAAKAKRGKSERVEKNNAAFFQQMNLRPKLDAQRQQQMRPENFA